MSSHSILHAPAPWRLAGRAYISVLHADEQLRQAEARHLPEPLREQRAEGPFSYLMYVDYAASPVGPYHELLFIPGSYRFPDGRRHLTISRIFVSSQDSVVNGQHNWGIPKQLARFELSAAQRGVQDIRVSQADHCFARLRYRSWPLPLPLPGSLTPQSWRRLAQYHSGQTRVYTPAANGLGLPARLLEADIDAHYFPALSHSQALCSLKLAHFRMRFPPAEHAVGCDPSSVHA